MRIQEGEKQRERNNRQQASPKKMVFTENSNCVEVTYVGAKREQHGPWGVERYQSMHQWGELLKKGTQ